MCLIIDANIFGEFFTQADFAPAYDWIRNGPGKVITGGTSYDNELKRSERTLALIVNLAKISRTIHLPDLEVDQAEEFIVNNIGLHSNDPHIIAMVVVSKCCIVCTKDVPLTDDFADNFRAKFGVRRPRVYKRKEHKTLLCNKNIANVCK